MSTPAQAAASIANSKLSTGPSSDAGEEAAFASHVESYRKAHAPANQPEEDLVRTLALFSQILQQHDYKDLDHTSPVSSA